MEQQHKGIDNGGVVSLLLREAGPLFLENGFEKRIGRSWFRYGENNIVSVVMRGVSKADAEVFGCTTYSVMIELNVYYPFLGNFDDHITPCETDTDGTLLPRENGLIFEPLSKTIRQNRKNDVKEVWYIRNYAEALECAADIKRVLESKVFACLPNWEKPAFIEKLLTELPPNVSAHYLRSMFYKNAGDAEKYRENLAAYEHDAERMRLNKNPRLYEGTPQSDAPAK